MAQHFLLSPNSRGLSITEISSYSDDEIFLYLKEMRWGNRDNLCDVECPRCHQRHFAYFIQSRKQWQCKHCSHRFSLLSNTIFHGAKLSLRQILLAVYHFSLESKGLSAIKLSHLLDVQYKTAWILLHKFREGLSHHKDLSKLKGVVHIDGTYLNFYVKQKNNKAERVDRRLKENRNPKRRCLLAFCQKSERYGGAERCIMALVPQENKANILPLVETLIEPKTEIYTDKSRAYLCLKKDYNLKQVNHSEQYCTKNGVNNNLAESLFSRLTRSLLGVYHKLDNHYIMLYANEICWREENRRLDVKQKSLYLLHYCLNTPLLADYKKYPAHRKTNAFFGLKSLIAIKG